MKNLLLALTVALLSACSVNSALDAAVITSSTVAVSREVDVVQGEVGKYSNNQATISELDAIQEEVAAVLQGKLPDIDILTIYARAKVVYGVLYQEVVERKDELTEEQLAEFTTLNNNLLALAAKVDAFEANEENTNLLTAASSLASVVTQTKTLISVCSAMLVAL